MYSRHSVALILGEHGSSVGLSIIAVWWAVHVAAVIAGITMHRRPAPGAGEGTSHTAP